MISYGFWQREFGGSPSAIGRSAARSTATPFDIVGVTPPSFFGVEVGRAFDVAVPLCAEPLTPRRAQRRSTSRTSGSSRAFGRLKPGWTLEQATAQLGVDLAADVPGDTLPPRYGADDAKNYLQFKLGAFAGRHRRVVAAAQLRVAAVAAARDHRRSCC